MHQQPTYLKNILENNFPLHLSKNRRIFETSTFTKQKKTLNAKKAVLPTNRPSNQCDIVGQRVACARLKIRQHFFHLSIVKKDHYILKTNVVILLITNEIFQPLNVVELSLLCSIGRHQNLLDSHRTNNGYFIFAQRLHVVFPHFPACLSRLFAF